MGTGTTSPVDLQLKGEGGRVLAEWTISDANDNPSRLDSGGADVLRLPLGATITRAQLRSVTLRIRGDDAWVLQDLFLFGLDTAGERPRLVVPLGHRSGAEIVRGSGDTFDWAPEGLD